jgi:thiamine-phosphate pyrophosphorylase
VGLGLVEYAARQTAKATASGEPALPWFAIGGIDHSNIGQVVEAGATRVVVVRAVTHADDPADAAARLRAQLPALSASPANA